MTPKDLSLYYKENNCKSNDRNPKGVLSIPRIQIGDFWKDMPLPIKWNNLFNRSASTWLEIGYGHGEFLSSLARHYPEINFIGIEVSLESHSKMIFRMQRDLITNIIPVVGDANVIFKYCIKNSSLSCIIGNFPDPWPKKRHEKRRLFQRNFLEPLFLKLKKHGIFYFASDDEEYSDFLCEEIKGIGFAGGCIKGYDLDGITTTRYEMKWLRDGRELHFFKFIKV